MAEHGSGRRLRTDVLLTFAGKLGTLALSTAAVVVVARALGPSGRGIVAVAYSLTLVLVQLGSLGIVAANPYFTAREPARLGPIVANSLWLAAGLGALLASVGGAVKLWFPGALAGVGWAELAVALAGVPAGLAAQFLQGVLLGRGRMVAFNAVELAQATLVLAALGVGFWTASIGVLGALVILVAGPLGATAAYVALLAPGAARARADLRLARTMLAYGFRVYLATVLGFLVMRADLLLVNSYLGAAQAGIYSVTAALAEGMVLLPMVVGLNLLPRVAREGGHEMSAAVFRVVAPLYALLCLATVPLAAPAVALLFGPEFEGAVALYYWLVPGVFALGMVTILSHHFAGRGFPIQAALVWLVGLVLNLGLNVAFLAEGGTYVASLASSISYTLVLVLLLRLFAAEAGGYRALWPRPRELGRLLAQASSSSRIVGKRRSTRSSARSRASGSRE